MSFVATVSITSFHQYKIIITYLLYKFPNTLTFLHHSVTDTRTITKSVTKSITKLITRTVTKSVTRTVTNRSPNRLQERSPNRLQERSLKEYITDIS